MYLLAPMETIDSTLPLLKQGAMGQLLSGRQITSLISNTAVQTGRKSLKHPENTHWACQLLGNNAIFSSAVFNILMLKRCQSGNPCECNAAAACFCLSNPEFTYLFWFHLKSSYIQSNCYPKENTVYLASGRKSKCYFPVLSKGPKRSHCNWSRNDWNKKLNLQLMFH